ncbi:efflux RND transporter permease subunit [Fretibacter rubidus]|uniref:efflux RND transporter permease subunit n=1 Tax=Fretibacter rubidus TaxID=570162 RepID=UPI00352ACF26
MNLAELSIKNPLICCIVILLCLFGGYSAYETMPRFEDPEFTIRVAKVFTQYPGASPEEVLNEVTEPLETAIQSLPDVKLVNSTSSAGLSDISVEIKFSASPSKGDLQVVWTKLRNKINDAQSSIAPGAGPSVVADDFGDVYGIYYLLTGEGFTMPELLDYAKTLRKELLLVPGVGKVALNGEQNEAIYVEISREQSASLGVSVNNIYNALSLQNAVTDAGDLRVGSNRINIHPSGEITTIEAIENLVVGGSNGSVLTLRDVADVKRGFIQPPSKIIRYDGQQAIGIGIANVSGYNVVKLGEALDARLTEIETLRPLGIELHEYYHQGKVVDMAIQDFVVNVFMSLAIVFVTLLIFMGFRSGVIMGLTVFITMAATLLFMWVGGIPMHRISLGALIISLGMLVDNGVVVTDGILVGIKEGRKKLDVAKEVARKNMKPLLGGTLVGIIAFAPIGFAPGDTAEFTNSLFWVVMIALSLSWLFAFTITPLFCYWLFPEPKGTTGSAAKKKSLFMRLYEGIIRAVLKNKAIAIAAVLIAFGTSIWGFQFVKSGFFPASVTPQVVVNFELTQGTDIRVTEEELIRLEKYIQGLEGVENVQTIIGGGTLRYMLTYDGGSDNSASGQILVKTADYRLNDDLIEDIQSHIDQEFPDALGKAWKFIMGPGGGSKIEATFKGPDVSVLKSLAAQAKQVMQDDGEAVLIKDTWGEQVPYLEPVYSKTKGERLGIRRKDLADALATNFSGRRLGVFREGEYLIPIISRAPEEERSDIFDTFGIQILSPTTGETVPLAQVLETGGIKWRDGRLLRENRVLTITAQGDPAPNVLTDDLFQRVKPKIEAIALPNGYSMEWDGEFGGSAEAQSSLASTIPLGLLAMILVVVFLFNSIRQPIIVWSVVPLMMIGVTLGLVLTSTPLEFMGILGLLSLSGLVIQNSLVLVDNTDDLIAQGMPRFDALVESASSRFRPVVMGAFTTVLGIAPLFFDAFFRSMTVVLAFGLSFATIITLLVTPALYAMWFRIRKDEVAA